LPGSNTVRKDIVIKNTRSLYENDTFSNSTLTGPSYYIVSNTDRKRGDYADYNGGAISQTNQQYYWNSDAPAGRAWNDTDRVAGNARSNAAAAFPDDTYVVRIEAQDESGNTTTKSSLILLDNWRQTVTTSKNRYTTDEVVRLTGGNEFRAGQTLRVYIVPAPAGARATPADGTELSYADVAATVTADANGKLPAVDLKQLPAGKYWVIADYDGQTNDYTGPGEFTGALDAAKLITVTTPPPPPPKKLAAANDSYDAVFPGGVPQLLTVAPPGVLANDTFTGTVSVVQVASSEIPGLFTLGVGSDGGVSFVPILDAGIQDFPSSATVTYYLTDGVTTSNVATVTVNITAGPAAAALAANTGFAAFDFAKRHDDLQLDPIVVG
jgi:hypothetical protein